MQIYLLLDCDTVYPITMPTINTNITSIKMTMTADNTYTNNSYSVLYISNSTYHKWTFVSLSLLKKQF